MEQSPRLRRGTVRADGKIFWSYRSRNENQSEIWLSPESFKKSKQGEYLRNKKKLEEYKKAQNQLPPEERNYRGKFIPETGLYFAYVTISGTAVYKTEEDFKAWLERKRHNGRQFHKRCKELPAPSCLLGDPHPTIPNLYVKRIYGHRVRYGTLEEAIKSKEDRNASCIKHRKLHKERRKKKLMELKAKRMQHRKDNPHLVRSRGDIDPVLGKIFWAYSYLGLEVWYDKETFEKMKAKATLMRHLRWKKAKERKSKN